MNKKALEILEYNKIIKLLEAECSSEAAKERARSLKPFRSKHLITEELRSTDEAVDLIVHKGVLPLSGLYMINESAAFAKKGGVLTMGQLLKIHYDLSIVRNCKNFLRDYKGDLSSVRERVDLLTELPALYNKIDTCIISEDEMSDKASPKLRQLRREISKLNESIKSKLNQMATSDTYKNMLQDQVVTMRNGRYVLPVKAQYRSVFHGIVHDQSKAGATLFIEPQVIVNYNNSLRETQLAEEAEINRILAEISSMVGEGAKTLSTNENLLTELDYIMAKGKLSLSMGGESPEINEDGIIDLINARHPLINKEKVVPISIRIGGEYRELIITGANTGGKTVTLKTVGLLITMCQSGLHIPASARSSVSILDDVYADIGDEQSIEQNLSTFSSHMTNIVDIVSKAREGTLILLDELGAGTDPTEGAALAISLLKTIRSKGALLISTTHYTELKKYAISTEGVENASMEFDVETLSPTYRLIMGVAGKSNAFEISKRLGLSDDIIEGAKELIDKNAMEFERVLSKIEEDKIKAERERDQAMELSRQMEEKLKTAEEELSKSKGEAEKLISKAKEEAHALIREAQREAKEVKEELRKIAKLESLGERNKAFDRARTRLKASEEKYSSKFVSRVNSEPVRAEDLRVGDRVKVLKLNQNGELMSLPDDRGEVQVKVGIMKMTLGLSDIMLIVDGNNRKEMEKRKNSSYGKIFRNKAMSVSPSINLQGQNLDDAIMNVGKYLDDAYIAGLKQVTVIHGRGEGILSKGLRNYFKSLKVVDSFRAGIYNEGGDGVTIVKLKTV